MSSLVSPSDIERIVGVQRHPTRHIGRAVSAEQTFYILHSQECKDSGIDLRDCDYSVALDEGIDPNDWTENEDAAVPLFIQVDGTLVPDQQKEEL